MKTKMFLFEEGLILKVKHIQSSQIIWLSKLIKNISEKQVLSMKNPYTVDNF